MAIMFFIKITELHDTSKHIKEILMPSIDANLRIVNAIDTSLLSLHSLALHKEEKYIRKRKIFWSIIEKNYKQLESYSTHWTDSEQVERLKKLNEYLVLFKAQQEKIEKELISNKNMLEIKNLENEVVILGENILALLRKMSDPKYWEMERKFRSVDEQGDDMNAIAMFFLLLNLIGITVLGLILIRAVISPLNRTIKLAKAVADGDYSLKNIEYIGDEKLDESLRIMALQLKERQIKDNNQTQQLEKYNKKLEESNNELSQFSYRTSHDLKAPMITIRGLAQAIKEDIETEEYGEAKNNAIKISKNVRKLEDLVVDILNLAKAELREESEELIDIKELVEDVKTKLDMVYIEDDIIINNCIENFTMVFSSRTRLSQVLENLISNSIKYKDIKKDEQYVSVFFSRFNGGCCIEVEDNGLGIPDEFCGRVFNMFQRFHPDVSFGSGLGLYIIKKHIEKMSGNIDFVSSEKGTRFTIKIPDGDIHA